jgi:multidrug efflux pump subunit AcrB
MPALQQMIKGLGFGLLLAVNVVFLLLAANYESIAISAVTLSTTPAVIMGALVMLLATKTTLNIQSFMGMIMAIGVSVANSILIVTFAEPARIKTNARPRRHREPTFHFTADNRSLNPMAEA